VARDAWKKPSKSTRRHGPNSISSSVSLSKVGKNVDAIRWYEQALRQQPGYDAAENSSCRSRCYWPSGAGDSDAQECAPDAIVLTNLGNAYLRQSKIQQAERTLRQALALDPDAPESAEFIGTAPIAKRG